MLNLDFKNTCGHLFPNRGSTYKSKDEIWVMNIQLDLQVSSTRSQKKETPSNFHGFWNKKLQNEKKLKKKRKEKKINK